MTTNNTNKDFIQKQYTNDEKLNKPKKRSLILPNFKDIKNTRKNWLKVKKSPYATMKFSLYIRKIIVAILIGFIALKGYDIVRNYSASGYMNIVGKIIMSVILIYVCYRIYQTIPYSKKQLEYYRKNPHLINYCPTTAKAGVDEILDMFKNKTKKEDINKNGVISK